MKNGMKSFWTKKYNQNIAKMIGICYRYVPVRETAEDIAHDAFLSAIEKADTYKGIGSFDAWLTRITVNKAISHLKQQRKSVPLSDEVAESEEDGEISSPDEMMTAIRKADFTQEEIMEAIAQLREHHRTVLNLYVFERQTHQQIAKILEISVNTSKSHLLRARKHLQEILFAKSKQRKHLLMFMFPLFSNTDKAFYSYCRHKMAGFAIPPHNPIAIGEVPITSPPSLRVLLHAHALPVITSGVVAASAGGLLWATHPVSKPQAPITPVPAVADSLASDSEDIITPDDLESGTVPDNTVSKTSRPKTAVVEPTTSLSDTSAVAEPPMPVVVKKVIKKNRHTVVIKDSTQQ